MWFSALEVADFSGRCEGGWCFRTKLETCWLAEEPPAFQEWFCSLTTVLLTACPASTVLGVALTFACTPKYRNCAVSVSPDSSLRNVPTHCRTWGRRVAAVATFTIINFMVISPNPSLCVDEFRRQAAAKSERCQVKALGSEWPKRCVPSDVTSVVCNEHLAPGTFQCKVH